MTKEVSLDDLQTLMQNLSDIIGYLTDNSCSDPDCCGGPYYFMSDFDNAQRFIEAKYGFKYKG